MFGSAFAKPVKPAVDSIGRVLGLTQPHPKNKNAGLPRIKSNIQSIRIPVQLPGNPIESVPDKTVLSHLPKLMAGRDNFEAK